MDSIVKRSLGAPVRQFTSCVTGVKGAGSRKAKAMRRKSAPCCHTQAFDSSWIREYQAELQRERQLRKVKCARKNAERAVRRTHHRGQHHSTKASREKKPLKTTGVKKGLPQNLADMVRPSSATKHEDSLFGALQGLSLNSGSAQSALPTLNNADRCKVM